MSEQIVAVLCIPIMFLPNILPFFIRKIVKPSYLWERSIIATSLYGLTFGLLWLVLFELGYSFESIGWKNFRLGDIVWSILFFVFAISVWWGISIVLSRVGLKYSQEYTVSHIYEVLLIFFYAVIAAPICEEACFRGYLITVIERNSGLLVAVTLSILFFALYHLPIGVGAFIHILFWAPFPLILFLWTKSLYPGMVMHALNNLLAYVILPLRSKGRIFCAR